MNRKSHIIGGFVSWVIAMGIYIWLNIDDIKTGWYNSMWILISLLTCLLGAEMSDYDLLWKSFLQHRHIFTHSIMIPVLIVLPVFTVTTETNFLLPAFGLFMIGYGSHLVLDLFPSWKEKDGKILDSRETLTWLTTGLTGDELYTKLQGTYLIHLPWKTKNKRKTLNLNATRAWLIVNALILFSFGIIIMFFFNKFGFG